MRFLRRVLYSCHVGRVTLLFRRVLKTADPACEPGQLSNPNLPVVA